MALTSCSAGSLKSIDLLLFGNCAITGQPITICSCRPEESLLTTPIDAITFEDIELFVQSGITERTVLDFKEDFPKRLDKAMSSLANTFGGMILIGVEETIDGAGVYPVKGVPLETNLRERVHQIALSNIYPPLIPVLEVRVVTFKSGATLSEDDRAVVVIRVHESDLGHAVENRTTVYIRVDNVSEPMRKATVEEIEWFAQKRQKSMGLKNTAISGANTHAQHFLAKIKDQHVTAWKNNEPFGRFVIWTVPSFPRLPIATPMQLLTASQDSQLKNVSVAFGTFPNASPNAIRDGIAWADVGLSQYYYTEIHELGLIYTEVEFWWDRNFNNRSQFLPEAAAKLLKVAVEFAVDLYRSCGFFGSFDLHMRVAGVKNRGLRNPRTHMTTYPLVMDDVVEFKSNLSTASGEEDILTTCKDVIRNLYWAFGRKVDEKDLNADFR